MQVSLLALRVGLGVIALSSEILMETRLRINWLWS